MFQDIEFVIYSRGSVGIRFNVDPNARLVAYTVDATTSRDQTREFLDAVLAHPHFERGFAFLGDRRGAPANFDADYLRVVVEEIGARAHVLAPCRWAVVVESEAGFGAIGMLAMLTNRTGVSFAPFTSQDRAAAWVHESRKHN